jgi:hypothetical protein
VLHAQYKPWGAGSALYSLQHGALPVFVTSFVFLMGLLFKVDGVSTSSLTYAALSAVMVTLCALFIAAWVAAMVAQVRALRRSLGTPRQASDSLSSGASPKNVSASLGVVSVAKARHTRRALLADASRAATGTHGGGCATVGHGGGAGAGRGAQARNDSVSDAATCLGEVMREAPPLAAGSDFVMENPMPRLAVYGRAYRTSSTRPESCGRHGVGDSGGAGGVLASDAETWRL